MGFLSEKKTDDKIDKKEKKAKKPEPRFKKVYSQYDWNEISVIVDTKTGVNYLLVDHQITPMIDADGKPVVTMITDDKE